MVDYDAIFEDFKDGKVLALYSRLYSGLLIFASDLLGPEISYMSEDCVQDAILDSYIHRHTFESATKWRNYLLTVIRNRTVDCRRKLNSHLNFIKNDTADRHDEDISVAMISQETFDMLYAAIDALPDRYREIFTLSFEKGLKTAEIASLIGLTEIGVKKRKARMLDMLRVRLGLKSRDDVLLIITASQLLSL